MMANILPLKQVGLLASYLLGTADPIATLCQLLSDPLFADRSALSG